MKPAHLDLFSGVGGFTLGLERAGFRTVAFSEIEPFPCSVLAERYPHIPNLGDINETTRAQIEALGQIDVVTFGSPCQDLSVAGKRLGFKGHRSSLFHEAIRIIRIAKPRFAVFENVPGLFSSASGWDFAAVLDEMAESGAMDIAWGVLDAQWFGVPQRRRRVFVIADFRGERAAEVLSISKGVCRDTPPSREAGKAVAALSANGVGASGADDNQGQGSGLLAYQYQGTNVGEMGTLRRGNGNVTGSVPFVAGGLTARYGKGVNTTVDDGAVIPVAFAENQRGEVRTSDTHPQLTAGGGKPGQGYPAVAFNETGQGWWNKGDRAGTLRAEGENRPSRPSNVVGLGMAVRRLTPLECERLQGFPDGWTDIPAKLASDSARYRAMGNAVAVPAVEWIAHRLRKELE